MVLFIQRVHSSVHLGRFTKLIKTKSIVYSTKASLTIIVSLFMLKFSSIVRVLGCNIYQVYNSFIIGCQ